MDITFLSAHLDDAVYSCGGLIHKLVQEGHDVEVQTFFTGDPNVETLSPFARELHARWGVEAGPMSLRRIEDQNACEYLGATYKHHAFLDCVYRVDRDGNHIYLDVDAIFGKKLAVDDGLIDDIAGIIRTIVDSGRVIYAPLTHGNHIDHQIMREAAERFEGVQFYFDLPYGLRSKKIPENLISGDMELQTLELSDENLEAWAVGCELYESQFNDYWSSPKHLRRQLRKYIKQFNGFQIWKR